MKIVFMGTPEFAVPILEALNERYEIVLVISQPNRLKKRGVLLSTPVCAKALELGLTVVQPEKISSEYDRLKELKADVLVTAAFGQFVPTKILKLFKKCLNVHGSLLPKYRGGAPIQRAMMNGDMKTGVTIMEMEKRMDAGLMYAKAECPITASDTATDLFAKLSLIGRDLLLENIEDIINYKNSGEVQDENQMTLAPILTAEEEIVNFHQPAFLIARHINALAMDPGALVNTAKGSFKVFFAQAIADESSALPGTVLSLKKQVLIKALDGAVLLDKILVPGKKILAAKDFVNGQKILSEQDVI